MIAAQSNKGLSVSTWRKKGGVLSSTTMWGWKRVAIIKYLAHSFTGLERDVGRETENEGESGGDRFAGEHVLAQ